MAGKHRRTHRNPDSNASRNKNFSLETPTFTRIVEERRVERAPVIEVLKRHPKLVALTALARTGQQGPFYIFAAFVFTYGTTMLHSSRDLLLAAVMCATALSAVTTPLAGHFSDRFGRKRMYIIGIAAIGVFTFIYFALLNTAIPVVIFVAIILSFIPHDMAYGPQAALIAECFPPRLRYSGSSLGFHLASNYRWWPSAADRNGASRLDRIGIFGRAVCPV